MYKTYSNYDLISSVDAQAWIDQGIIPVANSTDRDDLITTPAEGMSVYRLDNHAVQTYNGTNWSYAPAITTGTATYALTALTANSNGTAATITFGTALPAAPATVTIQGHSLLQNVQWSVASITSTGFSLTARNSGSVTLSAATVTFGYIAIYQRAAD